MNFAQARRKVARAGSFNAPKRISCGARAVEFHDAVARGARDGRIHAQHAQLRAVLTDDLR